MDTTPGFVVVMFLCVCVPCAGSEGNVTSQTERVASVGDVADILLSPGVTLLEIFITDEQQALSNDTFPDWPVLEKLVLHIDNIVDIHQGAFRQLPALHELQFIQDRHSVMCPSTGLNTLPNGIFEGLDNLKTLDLQSLCLVGLEEYVFNGLSVLQHLNLANNQIVEFERETFWQLTALVDINLKGNSLTEDALGRRLFQYCENITTMNLGYNYITELNGNMMSHHPMLDHLALDNNQISTIQDFTFQTYNRLWSLNLHQNFIEEIGHSTFAGLLNIHSIDLNNNRIARIEKDILSPDIPTLNSLLLHDNRLNYIDPEAFVGMNSLAILILNNNELMTLPDLVEQLPALARLEIKNNDWMCDCNLTWVFDLDDSHANIIPQHDRERIICDAPSAMRGNTYTDIQEQGLLDYCSPAEETTVSVFAGDAGNETTTGYLPMDYSSTESSKWKLHVIIICVIVLSVAIIAMIVVCLLCQLQRGKYAVTQNHVDADERRIDVPDKRLLVNVRARQKQRAWICDTETGRLEYLPPKAVEERAQMKNKTKQTPNRHEHSNPVFQNSIDGSAEPMETAFFPDQPAPEDSQMQKKSSELEEDTIDYEQEDKDFKESLTRVPASTNRNRSALESTSSQQQLLPSMVPVDEQELINEDDIPALDSQISLTMGDIVVHQSPKPSETTVTVEPLTETDVDVIGKPEGNYGASEPYIELQDLTPPRNDSSSDASDKSPSRRRRSISSAEHTMDSGHGNTDSDSVAYSDNTFSTAADVHVQSEDSTSVCSDYSSDRSTPVGTSNDSQTTIPKIDYNQNIEQIHGSTEIECR